MPKQANPNGYNGNPNLPLPEDEIQLTEEELREYTKCMDSVEYFIENYVKIVNVDKGIIQFKMWDFQKEIVRTFDDNRFVICKLARQTGKSTVVVCGYFLWYVLFHPDVTVGILANKEDTAIQLLDRWKLSFELLPRFLKQGIIKWDAKVIKLANNARIRASATSASAVRGDTFNILFLDEFAFVPENIALDFLTSVFPTISSGKTTKLFIVSTPNGYNLFYKIWNDSVLGINSYKNIGYTWRDVPGRDEKWADEQRRNMGSEQKFQQEHECDFMGSANTLVAPWRLKQLIYSIPLETRGNLKIYQKPVYQSLNEEGHIYVLCVDVGQGQNQDYSVVQVIDITQTPWIQVATWRANDIKPAQFASVIQDLGKYYNNGFLFFEINGEGHAVADICQMEYEYDNIIFVFQHPKKGQSITSGFQKKAKLGLKIVEATKRIGCTGLKSLIETGKLILSDYETIRELSTFVAKMNQQQTAAKTYQAEIGNHDDCISPLVLLGWLTMQSGFENYVGVSMRKILSEGEALDLSEPFVGILGDLERRPQIGTVAGFAVVDDPDFWQEGKPTAAQNWLN